MPARRRPGVVPDHDHRPATAPAARVGCSVTLDVAEQVDSGIEVTADFPSLQGDPATAFTYNLTITNNTPEPQTFTFDPTAPAGLDGDRVADRRGPGPDGDDRRRGDQRR